MALQRIRDGGLHPAVRAAARAGAEATTDSTLERRDDLGNDKSKVVTSFFALTRKHPAEVRTADVKEWQTKMEEQGALLQLSTPALRCFRSSIGGRWRTRLSGRNSRPPRSPSRDQRSRSRT